MSGIKIDQEELAVFLDEMEELHQILEEDIIKLEKEPDNPSLIAEIFRAAHTIKGSAAAMGFPTLSELAHSMESVFDGVRNGSAAVTTALVDVFMQCSDTIEAMRKRIADSGKDDAATAHHLESLGKLLSPKTEKPRAIASARVASAASPPAGDKKLPAPKLPAPPKTALENLSVSLDVEKSCLMPFVRAFQVLTFLSESCQVTASSPTAEEIENEERAFPMRLVISTRSGKERVREILEMISDVVILDIEEGDSIEEAPEPPAPPEPDAPPKPKIAEEPREAASEEEPSEEAQLPPEPTEAEAVSAPPATVPRETSTEHEPDKEEPSRAEKDAAKRSVRVNVERMDAIMDLIGELVINRTRLTQLSRELEVFLDEEKAEPVNETADNIELITAQLQGHIMKARLLPIERVFSKFPRMVRSLSQKFGKRIDLEIEGEKTELDRSVLEQIGDPLMHIIRNSIDHGVETLEERERAGKPPAGKIRIAAGHVEDRVIISISDDGKGLDPEKIVSRAREMNVAPAETLARLSDSEALNLVFTPGLSTRDTVSEISGRGVGMDVVKTNIQKLSGSVSIQSVKGAGTTITIKLPLTLAIIKSLLVTSVGRIFAIPLVSVARTLRLERAELQAVKGKETILFEGGMLPLLRLDNVFPPAREEGRAVREKIFIVVVSWAGRLAGLVVDSLIGDQDIVIRPLGEYIGEARGISGAAILGDGNIALIVDVEGLVRRKLEELDSAAGGAASG